jgi:hypothetical protein
LNLNLLILSPLVSTRFIARQRMETKSVDALIQELKALQLREAEVLALIEQANKRRDLAAGHHGVYTEHGTNIDHGFEQGDRIRITNKVTKPAHWGVNDIWQYRDAQRATVTFTTKERIYFVTDNGVTTWRAPRNIKRL